MAQEIDLGFERLPEGLDVFLASEGYRKLEQASNETVQVYFHTTQDQIGIFFYPVYEHDGGIDWKKEGYKIRSNLNIVYPQNEQKIPEEVKRISKSLVDKFNAIKPTSSLTKAL